MFILALLRPGARVLWVLRPVPSLDAERCEQFEGARTGLYLSASRAMYHACALCSGELRIQICLTSPRTPTFWNACLRSRPRTDSSPFWNSVIRPYVKETFAQYLLIASTWLGKTGYEMNSTLPFKAVGIQGRQIHKRPTVTCCAVCLVKGCARCPGTQA